MPGRAVVRLSFAASCALLLLGVSAACGGSPTAPTPEIRATNFTGTLAPGGRDFKPFAITYAGFTDLSVTINSLTTVAGGTPVTGITMGVGFGAVSGAACVMQIVAPEAPIGQELFVPNGATAGAYCVQIFDCLPDAEDCEPALAEQVTYSMTIRHF
jgi:hypothetical protein